VSYGSFVRGWVALIGSFTHYYACGSVLGFGVTVLPDPPWRRLVELMKLAEQNGFGYGWTYDSHVLRQEPYPLLTLAARDTERIKLGLNVTNPGTREPTVTASAFATLQDVSGGRMVMGIGRGDSARRDIGQKPVSVAEFEAACRMMRDLMNGRPVEWNDTEIELIWAQGRPEISGCRRRRGDHRRDLRALLHPRPARSPHREVAPPRGRGRRPVEHLPDGLRPRRDARGVRPERDPGIHRLTLAWRLPAGPSSSIELCAAHRLASRSSPLRERRQPAFEW
jgi:hypothetical protein